MAPIVLLARVVRLFAAPLAFALLMLSGCAEVGSVSADVKASQPKENWKRDVLATDLAVDVTSHEATAKISLAASTRSGASFEIGDLQIESVEGASGPIPFRVVGKRLDVGLPAKKPAEITVHYRYRERGTLEGATKGGLTFTWPTFCGNLFPCKSSPSDGLTFGLELTGVPAGQEAIYPHAIASDAPPYMLAWAIGDYTKEALGTTSAGTKVSVWYLPGEATAAHAGTKKLTQVFDFYEKTYGAYRFGDEVGSVSAPWGKGAFGGMEHHPFWHVSSDSMGDVETHAHEAAHGWFGDGVRLRCWEDLTLSEGTVSYLTARGVEAIHGKADGDALWASYEGRLDSVIASEDRVARPEGCDQVDVIHDLWNDVVYMKGAFFYRGVEAEVGREALDRAIARFYADNAGSAAGVDDMIETIQDETGFDAEPLAKGWLRSMGHP